MWYKDGNKSGCNIYIFFMTKVLCSGRCYKHVLATGGSNRPMLQMMSATGAQAPFFWAQSGWVASYPGKNEGQGICPSMSLPWEGWVLLLRKRPWWTGWKVLLEWRGDSMQKHLLMHQRRKCLSQASSSSCCTSTATFLSSFSSRGLSTSRSLCSASPNLL